MIFFATSCLSSKTYSETLDQSTPCFSTTATKIARKQSNGEPGTVTGFGQFFKMLTQICSQQEL